MAALITTARALFNLANRTLTLDETTTLSTMIDAASKWIQRFCARDFVQTTYIEYLHGNNSPWVFVKNIPVITLTRVMTDPNAVLTIQNTDSSTNQIASFYTTTTGIVLKRIASGTTTTSTLLWTSYTTVSSLVTAIDALGSGWDAVLTSGYSNWPTNLIYENQGPIGVIGQAQGVKSHTTQVTEVDCDFETGAITRIPNTDYLHYNMIWRRGHRNIRVDYTGGFSTVPEEVQEACGILAAAWFLMTKRDPGLIMERTADYTYQTLGAFNTKIPPAVRSLLSSYRRVRF